MTKTKLGKALLWVGLTIWIALAAFLLAQSLQAHGLREVSIARAPKEVCE